MILDSIVLNNFGAYCGLQEAVLTPDENRPIILFGGMNGGGKTTLLDALQLAFYGSKARISNRGRLGYKDYLRESIHRSGDTRDGAGITVCYHRMIGGEVRHFELQRFWHDSVKGIEETVKVLRDGIPDHALTEHWDESIEAYLPSSIAHLFFFDGEQIKDLAEGSHAAEILGTAVYSLLGLDLVNRLENDLNVFERRKKSEKLDQATVKELVEARIEYDRVDREQEKAAMQEGVLVNEVGRLAKELQAKEDKFRIEGGELYLHRTDLENELGVLKKHQNDIEVQFRELSAGSLPLILVKDLLDELENVACHEADVNRARVLLDALETRDGEVLAALRSDSIGDESIQRVERVLKNDRSNRAGLAQEPLLLKADETLVPQLSHLSFTVLPASLKQAKGFIEKLSIIEERLARLESEIERVPSADRIAVVQQELDVARNVYEAKLTELNALRIHKQALRRQHEAIEAKMDKLGETNMNIRFAEDDRQRTLKHSHRVRETLAKFRTNVVKRHAIGIESLMLESFRKLLRKTDLIRNITIDPATFETILTGQDGRPLSFDRLSAGEKQLLATSLLWGLARASGRPIPTIIDTPLGRLDSSHRRHIIERYFPNASHQVLLLSTDEEIVGPYYKTLHPFITRSYLLKHNEELGQTRIESGYFSE